MQKVLLMSVLFAQVLIPILASRRQNLRAGLGRALIGVLAFNVLYLAALLIIYPRL